jgi:hypothetical protein
VTPAVAAQCEAETDADIHIPTNDINTNSAAQIAGITELVGSAERLPATSNDESKSEPGYTFLEERHREARVHESQQNITRHIAVEETNHETEAVAAQPSRASIQTAVAETASLQATSFGKKDHVKYTDANGVVRAGVVAEGTLVTYIYIYLFLYKYTYTYVFTLTHATYKYKYTPTHIQCI